jgi:AcrR family transcriptional regulator
MGLKGLREERREHAIRLILTSATEVFAERGYNGTSMDDIAQRVDCAPATLYGYFKGKAKIFSRIWEEKSVEYLDGVAATLSGGGDFNAALNAYFSHFEGSVEKNADFVRLLITVLRTHDTGAFPEGETHQEHQHRYMGLLTDLMQRGIDEGALDTHPPELLAISFLGMLHATVYAWMLTGAEAPFAGLIDHVRSLFLNGAAKGSDQ